MAAAKEPASVIAGQLRHADGGTLASRTYIHQLPHTPPRLARLIEAMYGPAARQATSDDRNGEKADRKLVDPATALESYTTVFPQVRWVAGTGFEPV
jgi:hypothetical protein